MTNTIDPSLDRRRLLVAGLLSGLAGCGGGGSAPAPEPAPPPPPPPPAPPPPPTLQVSLLAGSSQTAGSADGGPATAQFRGPAKLAVDARGVCYVADVYSRTLRRISPEGQVTTLAGADTLRSAPYTS